MFGPSKMGRMRGRNAYISDAEDARADDDALQDVGVLADAHLSTVAPHHGVVPGGRTTTP